MVRLVTIKMPHFFFVSCRLREGICEVLTRIRGVSELLLQKKVLQISNSSKPSSECNHFEMWHYNKLDSPESPKSNIDTLETNKKSFHRSGTSSRPCMCRSYFPRLLGASEDVLRSRVSSWLLLRVEIHFPALLVLRSAPVMR